MSEPAPEGGSPGGGFMSAKFLGVPAIVWLLGAAVLAYFYFKSSSSSSSSTGSSSGQPNQPQATNSGTQTAGAITVSPGTTNFNITSQYAQTQTASNTGAPAPRHRTPNPQPTPKPKKPTKTHTTTVKTPAKKSNGGKSAAQYVTVAKFPGASSGGLAQWNTTLWGISNHEHVSIATLLKLNPQIKNANLVYPGERIKI
jgi:hypothetical protein